CGAVLLAAALLQLAYLTRRRALLRRVGSFQCSVRRGERERWSRGMAHYGAGRLDWYRRHSLSPRPARSWRRSELTVVGRTPVEIQGGRNLMLIRCRYGDAELELVASGDAAA